MRLFVAIDLTPEAREAIAAIGKRIAVQMEDGGTLRFVRPEHLHLTLAFIGEVDETRGAAILESMAGDFEQDPFEMAFGGIGVFPPRGAPRALWVGVAHGLDAVVELQRLVSARLETVGVEREKRPFSPHLTLARWRRSRPSNARRALADTIGIVAHSAVTSVTVYESRLTSSAPNYRALHRTPLAGRFTHRDM